MLVLFFVTACKDRLNPEAISAINHSLNKANEIIIEDNEVVYRALDKKAKDPCTKAKMELWHRKALSVKALSDEVCQYIISLKEQLAVIKKDDEAGVRVLLRKEGDSLCNKLVRYNSVVVRAINPEELNDNPFFKAHLIKDVESFKKNIASRSGIRTDSLIQYPADNEHWKEIYLNTSSLQLGMAVLNKIQHDVLVTENELITYMNNLVGCHINSYDVFQAIAVLNSSYVKAGQPIEVTAGVGAFSAASKTNITINGSVVQLDDDGTATYKLATNQKPGKYRVPVRIEYTKQDGSTDVITKYLEYIIAE